MNNAIALTVLAIDQIGTLDFLGLMPPKTGDLRFDVTLKIMIQNHKATLSIAL